MCKKLKAIALFLLVFQTIESYSQNGNRIISGLISSDENSSPLEGVTVRVKGSNKVSGSQSDGIYYISVAPTDSILVFSYDDFLTEEIKLTSANEYNVLLKRGTKPVATSFSPSGIWRGVFRIKDNIEVPFNFAITGTTSDNSKIYFINAEERFDGGRLHWTSDSLFIYLDQFDNELALKIESNTLNGVLRRQDKTGTIIPVEAEKGITYRFKETVIKPLRDISGTYEITFKGNKEKDEKAVGLFKQEGNKLRGTFLRITGDSRYLEGIIIGNNFYLSTFIGSTPGYYKGTINTDGTITGEIINVRGTQNFTGTPNEEASLPDPYKLTFLKEGYTSLDFSFPGIDGKPVSLKDKKYKNKVVVITIGGTWCPNCVDEAAFLAPWYKENKKRGVEIIAIHYERKTDSAYVKKVISRFNEKFDIQYDEVFAGLADKQQVAASLPALNTFLFVSYNNFH